MEQFERGEPDRICENCQAFEALPLRFTGSCETLAEVLRHDGLPVMVVTVCSDSCCKHFDWDEDITRPYMAEDAACDRYHLQKEDSLLD